jgi:hypothetical protein
VGLNGAGAPAAFRLKVTPGQQRIGKMFAKWRGGVIRRVFPSILLGIKDNVFRRFNLSKT